MKVKEMLELLAVQDPESELFIDTVDEWLRISCVDSLMNPGKPDKVVIYVR